MVGSFRREGFIRACRPSGVSGRTDVPSLWAWGVRFDGLGDAPRIRGCGPPALGIRRRRPSNVRMSRDIVRRLFRTFPPMSAGRPLPLPALSAMFLTARTLTRQTGFGSLSTTTWGTLGDIGRTLPD